MSLTCSQPVFPGGSPALRSGKGPRFIAVLGPDGSGKSELAQSLTRLLERRGGQVSNFHWRPQYPKLPGPAVVVTHPHAQKRSSFLRSTVKLLYLVWEFNIGYIYKLRPLLRSQQYVIFDRYYHDILVDPLRYRYNAPMALARWAARLVPQPGIWIILDAPTVVLRKRKQEVSEQETEQQRLEYILLAQRLPNSHVLDSMRAPEDLAEEVAALLA